MRADHVEVSWNDEKHKWQVRIQVGEEVIRRFCDLPQDADEQKIRSAARQTLADEGYEASAEDVSLSRAAA
jgi:hypothetical protein